MMLPPKWEAGAGGGEGGHYPGQARRPLSVSTPTAQPTGGALELAKPQAGLSAPITALREQWRPWGPAVKFKGGKAHGGMPRCSLTWNLGSFCQKLMV